MVGRMGGVGDVDNDLAGAVHGVALSAFTRGGIPLIDSMLHAGNPR